MGGLEQYSHCRTGTIMNMWSHTYTVVTYTVVLYVHYGLIMYTIWSHITGFRTMYVCIWSHTGRSGGGGGRGGGKLGGHHHHTGGGGRRIS